MKSINVNGTIFQIAIKEATLLRDTLLEKFKSSFSFSVSEQNSVEETDALVLAKKKELSNKINILYNELLLAEVTLAKIQSSHSIYNVSVKGTLETHTMTLSEAFKSLGGLNRVLDLLKKNAKSAASGNERIIYKSQNHFAINSEDWNNKINKLSRETTKLRGFVQGLNAISIDIEVSDELAEILSAIKL